jgi:hypothetical protein
MTATVSSAPMQDGIQSLVNNKDGFCFRFAHRSEEIMTPARSLPVIFAAILVIAIGILLGAVTSGSRLVSAAHAQSDRAGTGSSSICFKLNRK